MVEVVSLMASEFPAPAEKSRTSPSTVQGLEIRFRGSVMVHASVLIADSRNYSWVTRQRVPYHCAARLTRGLYSRPDCTSVQGRPRSKTKL